MHEFFNIFKRKNNLLYFYKVLIQAIFLLFAWYI
jgi:hypothetical protein